MEPKTLHKCSEYKWRIDPTGKMNVPAYIFADEKLISQMDEQVRRQACNVAALPGIVKASYVMPDAHWGYGFPIGGVAAFDPKNAGVISAGGVGFDIACGVRALNTKLTLDDVEPLKKTIADTLAKTIPAGVGSTGKVHLKPAQIDDMLAGGAKWAVENGYGTHADLECTEQKGYTYAAKPDCVSDHAKNRQKDQIGTLGSGNHYLELQLVTEIYSPNIADVFGLKKSDIVISIHCGSRGLGHQIATDFLKKMIIAAKNAGIELPERELACAPILSDIGQKYLGAMRCSINSAVANRQLLTHLLRKTFAQILPKADLTVLYDVSHNTCKEESHIVDGKKTNLFVHRKGATRSFGPNQPDLPPKYRQTGQPVLIGGTMGTASYILAGTTQSMDIAFGSACHGAGRNMSRKQATKQFHGKNVINNLASRGILIRSPSLRGVAEEAPQAYKDVSAVVDAAHNANLATKVAKLEPIICIKG